MEQGRVHFCRCWRGRGWLGMMGGVRWGSGEGMSLGILHLSVLLIFICHKRLTGVGNHVSWNRMVLATKRLWRESDTIRAMNPVVRSDIVVADFLDSVGGYRHKERRDRLLDILDVDLDWFVPFYSFYLTEWRDFGRHMHAISDGERRRVQICMGLMKPWDVLLLDEVNSSLNCCKTLSLESGHRGSGRSSSRSSPHVLDQWEWRTGCNNSLSVSLISIEFIWCEGRRCNAYIRWTQ